MQNQKGYYMNRHSYEHSFMHCLFSNIFYMYCY